MKASKLIKELQLLIDERGDMEVFYLGPKGGIKKVDTPQVAFIADGLSDLFPKNTRRHFLTSMSHKKKKTVIRL